MDTFFSRYKNPLVLAFVLLVQFVLLAVQVKPRLPGAAATDQTAVSAVRTGVTTAITPPESALHHTGRGISGIWDSYIDLVNLKQKNEQLQEENQRLQLEQAALAEDARQGERLQEILAFKQHYIDTTVPAQVVGTGGTDHGRILYIDKGADDGIQPDMPVITTAGIVGRIRDVTAHTSQVLEISDPTSAAGVLLVDTRTRGILRGNGVGQAQIVNLMPDDRIKKGQLVLTSGGDQVFPRGLPVGVVDKVIPDEDNQPLVDVLLKPAADLGQLEEVLVVTGTSTSPGTRARQDLAMSEGTATQIKAAAVAKATAAAKSAAAAEAVLEAQRASDILAQRLPSASNTGFDPDDPDGSAAAAAISPDQAGPLHPGVALHADHYTPGQTPDAAGLTPGQRLAPIAQGGSAVSHHADAAAPGADGNLPNPAVAPAFAAARAAALAARPHAPQPKPTAPSEGQSASPVAGTTAATHPPSTSAVGVPRVASGIPGATHTVAGSAAVPRTPGATYPASSAHPVTPYSATPRSTATSGTVPHVGAPVANGTSTVLHPAPRPTTTVPGQATTPRPANPTNGQSTTQRPPAASTPHPAASGSNGTPVKTQIISDGPIHRPTQTPQAPAPQANHPATGQQPATPPRRKGPTLVPDDGSRPPTTTPHTPEQR